MRTLLARPLAPRRALPVAAAAIALGAAARNPLGPRQLPIDRFDYNAAIADSASQQMLLNLVRLRFGEVPTFLAVNSVLTRYVWSGDLGVAGTSGENLNFPVWTVGGSTGLRYIESLEMLQGDALHDGFNNHGQVS